MDISFAKLILWTGSISVFLPVIVIKIFPGKIPATFYWLYISLLITLILEIASKVFWVFSINNMPLFHLHTLFEFILVTLFFRSVEIFTSIKTAFLVMGVFLILWIVPFLYDQSEIYRYNAASRSVASFIFILYAALYLLKSLKDNVDEDTKSVRLIIFPILIYSATCLLIFLSGQYIQELSKDLNRAVWSIHGLVIILYNILLAIGLWRLQKKRLSSI